MGKTTTTDRAHSLHRCLLGRTNGARLVRYCPLAKKRLAQRFGALVSKDLPARTPNFFAAMEIVAKSDLVTTLPESLLKIGDNGRRFISRPTPLRLNAFPMSLAWHGRHQDAPRHVWLRSTIVAAAREW